ncbi:MAG: uracil-DNA glycosylase [Pseudomonadota bacterium]
MKDFDIDCRQCPRLAGFLDEVKHEIPSYYCRPVPSFGAPGATLLVVGLAPGKHGANATGRAFTGDHAGVLLYQTLYETGFSSLPESVSADDDLELLDCRITNAVKCLPPENKPTGGEVNNCNQYLIAELEQARPGTVIVALGGIAHRALVKAARLRQKDFKFGHANEHQLGQHHLIDSYHCSRYNTQTRRLTPEMFRAVFARCRELIGAHD